MRKSILFALLVLFQCGLYAHNMNYRLPAMREWCNVQSGEHVLGSFLVQKKNEVLVQNEQGLTQSLNYNQLSAADRQWLHERSQWIAAINSKHVESEPKVNIVSTSVNYFFWISASLYS